MSLRSRVVAAVAAAFLLLGVPPIAASEETRADSAAVPRSPEPERSVVVGGLIHAQAEAGDRPDDRFTTGHDRFFLRRARLSASGRLHRHFDFKLELEVAGSLSEASGLRAQTTDTYVEWTRHPLLGIRAGQFKTPFGFEQLVSDPRLFTIERSLANDRLTLGRQIGVQFSGQAAERRLTWAGGAFNGTGTGTSANDDDNFLYVARLAATLLQDRNADLAWSLAADGYLSHDDNLSQPGVFGFDSTPGGGNDNVFRGRRHGVGIDTQLHLKRADVWLEYLRADFEPESDIPRSRLKAEGGYAQVTLFLVPKRLQAAVRYDSFRPSLDGDPVARSWYFGGSGLVKGDEVKLQLGHLLSRLSPGDDTEGRTLARLQVVF
jgi:phosphate-selective porin OprO/OprP